MKQADNNQIERSLNRYCFELTDRYTDNKSRYTGNKSRYTDNKSRYKIKRSAIVLN
jgi:hypothetical protein